MNKEDLTVEKLEACLMQRLYHEDEDDFTFFHLSEAYVDIIQNISKAHGVESLIIHDYAKLLGKEIQLYSSAEAFEAGHKSKDEAVFKIMNDYFCDILEIKTKQHLDAQIQLCFDKIKELLGGDSTLVAEFTELYNRVHGVVKNNIHEFIRLGQISG